MAEVERAADREGFGDSHGWRGIADHYVHLVRASVENELRSSPSPSEAFNARSPHRRQRLERPSTGPDVTPSTRRGFPSDDNNDGTILRDAVCTNLALRRFGPCAGRPNDEKGARICHRSITR